jgi:hypothetical protein
MLYDSADLVQRCRDAAQLPVDDEMMDDAAWYRLLTEAQATFYPQLAAQVPQVLLSAPRLLTSTDGYSYSFGLDEAGRPVMPLAVQVYRRLDDALRSEGPGTWGLAPGQDFRQLGDRLEFPWWGPRPVLPDGGPWVRYIAPPGVIDAEHEPVLLPVHARQVLVYAAVEAWASQGDLRDPSAWRGRALKLWTGDPANPADVGLLGALKLAFPPPPSVRGGRLTVLARTY